MSAALQPCLPGLEPWRKPDPWKPQPHTLARVQSYLEGFRKFGMQIFAKRRYIAQRLGIHIATLSRYLRYLASIGWIETVRRTSRAAIRCIRKQPPSNQSAATPSATSQSRYPSYELKPENNLPEEPRMQPSKALERRVDPFEAYIGVFLGAGKALNERDVMFACREWVNLTPAEQQMAHQDALRAVREASSAQYVPMPRNHLVARGWTRKAVPGARPMSKAEQLDAEVSRIMREKRERRTA